MELSEGGLRVGGSAQPRGPRSGRLVLDVGVGLAVGPRIMAVDYSSPSDAGPNATGCSFAAEGSPTREGFRVLSRIDAQGEEGACGTSRTR
jgi:hypothetical protein